VSLSTLVPDPGAENWAGVRVDVTPVGNPLTESETAELNPPLTLTVRFRVPLAPAASGTEFTLALNWKAGTVLASLQ
jgi:hypothetical protein